MFPDTDARHVDVAILYALGMRERAHALGRDLRPERVVFSRESTANIEWETPPQGGEKSVVIEHVKQDMNRDLEEHYS